VQTGVPLWPWGAEQFAPIIPAASLRTNAFLVLSCFQYVCPEPVLVKQPVLFIV
jgi:hypothetical protein